ncbi:MAG: hypothetical protein ACO1SV_03750 [Fimbriimonas sp.]
MQRLTDETRLDDATQRQIITLAAELQRLEGEGATIGELEERAREVGIEPKYIRIAMGRVDSETVPVVAKAEGRPSWHAGSVLTLLFVLAFVCTQAFVVVSLMEAGRVKAPIVLPLAAILGMVFGQNRSRRLGAASVLLGTTVATVVATLLLAGFQRPDDGLAHNWSRDVPQFVVLEFVFLIIGIAVATGSRWIANQAKPPR